MKEGLQLVEFINSILILTARVQALIIREITVLFIDFVVEDLLLRDGSGY